MKVRKQVHNGLRTRHNKDKQTYGFIKLQPNLQNLCTIIRTISEAPPLKKIVKYLDVIRCVRSGGKDEENYNTKDH